MVSDEVTTHVMHFSVEGAFLTGCARDFVEEGNWRRAYSFLMDNLQGMEAQLALDILQGKKKLTGTNDIEVEDDTAEETVSEWLNFQYGDCFSYRGRQYRPYGYVSAFNRADMRLAQQIREGEDADMLRNKLWVTAFMELGDKSTKAPGYDKLDGYLKYRPAYYARERRSDICVGVALPGRGFQPVLCEEVVVDLPLWYTGSASAETSILEAFGDGKLVDRYAELNEDNGPVTDVGTSLAASPFGVVVKTAFEVAQDIVAQEAADEAAATEFEGHLSIWRQQIAFYADHDVEYGWLAFDEFDEAAKRNVTIRVPHRAFICAALGRAKAYHLMPEYDARCPCGLKLYNDDRFHSDAWIGAGFAPNNAYESDMPEQRLFMEKLYELQRKHLSFDFDVLARGSQDYVYGEVIHDPNLAGPDKILVVSQAAPEYAMAALKCKAVVVETGSKLAHLAIVSREEGIPVIRVAGAVEKFHVGRSLSIDLAEGKVELSSL